MAYLSLSANFNYFFRRLNPSSSFQMQASSEYQTITGLIENPLGLARELSPKCFLQGSYKQDTAIYTINDIDIVALCELWQPGSGSSSSRSWGRNEIFDTIAAPLLNDRRYCNKVLFNDKSMCIKVDLGIKIEILPVVYKAGNYDRQSEPFRLYRPEKAAWEDGYARYHQGLLSSKNRTDKTSNNFIPAIKVLKHIRSKFSIEAVSFHIECLLFAIPDYLFLGTPADYIAQVLNYIASITAEDWYRTVCKTPCGERDIFTSSEWKYENWVAFHKMVGICGRCAYLANQETNREKAITFWQAILGDDFFPRQVSL